MKFNLLLVTPLVLLFVALQSCKKYSDPPLIFEDNADTSNPVQRKVLLIAIDGGVGQEYKAIAPPAITGMLTHSKYTWDAVSERITTDAASWKTLLSGVSYDTHLLRDSTFIFTKDPDNTDDHATPSSAPSFYSYILSSTKSELRASVISPWETMLTRVVPDLEDKVLAADDKAVKDSALVRIKNEKSDLIIVNFNSVAIAGKAGSFSATSTTYKNAVLTVDGYVGEIMTALKARPQYNKKEEWLVIVTSTHGGINNTYGGSTYQEKNTFAVYYNEKLVQKELQYSGIDAVRLYGSGSTAVRAVLENDATGKYNPGTGDFTIQLKAMVTESGLYPWFFSRRARFSAAGWAFFAANDATEFDISPNGSRYSLAITNNNFADAAWHDITAVIETRSNGTRYSKTYFDGVSVNERTIPDGSISSTLPLTLGHLLGGDYYDAVPMSFYAAEIKMFKKALQPDEIASQLCANDISKHPSYSSLVGYWPCTEGVGSKFVNMAPGASGLDFVLKGAYKWEQLTTTVPCNLPPPTGGLPSIRARSVDVVPQIFYWMKIATNSSVIFEGSSWLNFFETEFIGL